MQRLARRNKKLVRTRRFERNDILAVWPDWCFSMRFAVAATTRLIGCAVAKPSRSLALVGQRRDLFIGISKKFG